MRYRTLDEMVSHFNREVSEMDIDQSYKIQLLGMVSAIAYGSQKPRWIPCSERLPNTHGIYIVTRRISDRFECRNITDALYFDGSNTWNDDARVNHGRKYCADVLAWMPLPEPYKAEE